MLVAEKLRETSFAVIIRWLSVLFLVCAASLSQATESRISRENVILVLSDIHTVNWSSLIKGEADHEPVRDILRSMVQDKSLAPPLRNRALSEYGKFAVLPDGTLDPDAARLYRDLSSTSNGAQRLALIDSLTSATTPEATELLLEQVQETDSSESFYVLAQLERVVSGPKSDREATYSAEPYEPHLRVPLIQRKNQDAWKRVLTLTEKRLKKIASAQHPEHYQKRLEQTLASIEPRASSASVHPSVVPSKPIESETSAPGLNKSAAATPESVENQQSEESNRWPYFLLAIGLATAIFWPKNWSP
jgi:hypothetical protein